MTGSGAVQHRLTPSCRNPAPGDRCDVHPAAAVRGRTRDALFHDGVWTVDYVRLRFHAIRTPSDAV
jgi:hypothetical protein